jgi:hypothetical protein
MTRSKPLTPAAAMGVLKNDTGFPDEVVAAWNDLLLKYLRADGVAVITQQEAVAFLVDRLWISRQAVFERHLLDVEPLYRKAGWKVEYEKAAYYEVDRDSVFTFRAPRRRAQ